MHASELDAIMAGTAGDVAWPPARADRERWQHIADFRRRYINDAGEMFAHRPDLHIPENAPGTFARQQVFTPVPLARDIPNYSAALLFSEPPKIVMPEGLEALQPDLEEWLQFNRVWELLLDAADTVASEGGCALRVVMDDHISSEYPAVTFHSEDCVLWSTRQGRYTRGGILAIEAEGENSSVIWRLLESHEPGRVRRLLFKGSSSRLGKRHDLSSGPPQFRDLRPESATRVDKPTLIKWQNRPGGDPDLAGCEALLDAYDEGYSIGRIKLRASQPITILREIPFGSLRALGGLPMHTLISLDDSAGGTSPSGGFIQRHNSVVGSPFPTEKLIETSQPGLEADQHRAYMEQLQAEIVTRAGYSLASWGLDREGRADSGTALKLRQGRTLSTRAIKEGQAVQAIKEMCAIALAMQLGRGEAGPLMPEVALGDGLPRDDLEAAEELVRLRSAGVISKEEGVRRLNPDWPEEKIAAEASRIEGAPGVAAAGRQPQLRSIGGS